MFQTILGIMEVNSYLAFKSVTKMNVIHKDFVNSLAAELCHFLPSSCGDVETVMLQPQDMPGDERDAVYTQVRHEIVPASSLKSGAHGQCRVPGCLGDAYMVAYPALLVAIRMHRGYTFCVAQGYRRLEKVTMHFNAH